MVANILLTNCEACAKEISFLADKCPGCGSPNNWQHPAIKDFWANEDSAVTTETCTFESDITEIWGQTTPKFTWWMWLIVAFFGIPGLAFGIIPGLIIAPVTYFILLRMYGKKKEFRANLQLGTWESNDDIFWKPVRDELKL